MAKTCTHDTSVIRPDDPLSWAPLAGKPTTGTIAYALHLLAGSQRANERSEVCVPRPFIGHLTRCHGKSKVSCRRFRIGWTILSARQGTLTGGDKLPWHTSGAFRQSGPQNVAMAVLAAINTVRACADSDPAEVFAQTG